MVDKGIVETVLNCGGEDLAVLLIQRQDGHDLVQQHLVHITQNHIIVHAVADDVMAAQVCAQNETGVGTVQDADLALLIRSHVGSHEDVGIQACCVEGQLVGQEEKDRVYAVSREFRSRFEARFGCTGCGALLNREHPQTDWDWAAELNSRRICIVFVVEAVRMLEEYLKELGVDA